MRRARPHSSANRISMSQVYVMVFIKADGTGETLEVVVKHHAWLITTRRYLLPTGIGGSSFERIRDSTCPQTVGSDSISM